VELRHRIALALAVALARLTGLDELLDAVALPLLFLEYCGGRRGVSDGATASRLSGALAHHRLSRG
jgi:hypothetical protein